MQVVKYILALGFLLSSSAFSQVPNDASGVPNASSAIIIGATPVVGGINGQCVFNNNGTAGNQVCGGSVIWSGSSHVGNCPVIQAMGPPVVLVDSGTPCLLGGGCTQSQAFLDRTSDLDTAHILAYQHLICGLVTDGIWAKLDIFYVFGTKTQTDALLNLVSTSFTGVAHGSPTFTTDRGFTGVDASTTIYIDTGFNASTAGGNYTQNGAHIAGWSLTGTQSSAIGGIPIGAYDGSTATQLLVYYSSGSSFGYVNLAAGGNAAQFVDTTAVGHYVAVRSDSATESIYKNGVVKQTLASGATSASPVNLNFFVLARDNQGSPDVGDGREWMAVSAGGALSATDVTNYYNRLVTYKADLGIP